jgi:hypothetical protein
MSPKIPDPPRGGIELVGEGVQELLPARFPHAAHADVRPEVASALPVVHLGLDQLRDGAGLDAGELVAWRHVVRVAGEPVALADTDADPGGGATLRQVNYGPYVGSVARLVDRAAPALERTGGALRLVQVPALYVLALWHERDGENDTVVPLDPAPSPFEAGREYPAREFEKLLTEAARAVGPGGSGLAEDEEDTEDRPGSPRPLTR